MGSIITLGIERLELDWGKNQFYRPHNKLFQVSDKGSATYYYAEDYQTVKSAYLKKLKDVKCRLELLGYTLYNSRQIYYDLRSQYDKENYPDLYEISFELYSEILKNVNLINVNPDLRSYGDYDFGEEVSDFIFSDPEFNKIYPLSKKIGKHEGEFFANLDPYVTIRLLVENPQNSEMSLIWRYYDIVEAGYSTDNDILQPLDVQDKFLIVTEGSSDLFIIRKAFEILRPDIADFFTFVDMEDNYPFTGTGNLYKFCQGLTSIGLINKVIIIYDNDLEGKKGYELTKKLKLPVNMRVMKLPDLPEFTMFATIGPNGMHVENINGRAVAIENFLDLNYKQNSNPQVRWKTFDEKENAYHGALVNKDLYVRAFKSVRSISEVYDFRKLNLLLDAIYMECVQLSDEVLLTSLMEGN